MLPELEREKSQTLSVNVVVCEPPPPVPVTVIVNEPTAAPAAVMVRVLVAGGVGEVLKEQLTLEGGLVQERVTAPWPAELATRVAVMVFEPEPVARTEVVPLFESEKSQTWSVNVVMGCNPNPPLMFTVTV